MAAANRIPISVRISQEDADFIAELKIEGANTPSEKIRELLTQARLAHSQTHDYGTALAAQEQFFQVARRDVLHAEKEAFIRTLWRGCLSSYPILPPRWPLTCRKTRRQPI